MTSLLTFVFVTLIAQRTFANWFFGPNNCFNDIDGSSDLSKLIICGINVLLISADAGKT